MLGDRSQESTVAKERNVKEATWERSRPWVPITKRKARLFGADRITTLYNTPDGNGPCKANAQGTKDRKQARKGRSTNPGTSAKHAL